MTLIPVFFLIFSLVYAQTTQNPADAAAPSECLEQCYKASTSPVSEATNFRDFEKLIKNIDEFCRSYLQLTKCSESCNENDRTLLQRKTVIDDYICIKKIEEFRVAKECVQSQETDSIGQCTTSCSYPTEKSVQLGIITLTEAINPAAYFEALTPTCKSLECTIRCSARDLNKKCAGSGELFKEVGKQEVTEVNARLQSNQNISSAPVEGHIAGVFLNSVPEQCAYLVDPDKFDTLFVEEEEEGAEMPTQVANLGPELATTTPQGETESDEKIRPKFGEIDDESSTRIVDIVIEPGTEAPHISSDESHENAQTESNLGLTTPATVTDSSNSYDVVLRPSSGKGDDVRLLEGIVEHPENQPPKSTGNEPKQEVEPAEDTEVGTQSSDNEGKSEHNVTEKTIRVVDDGDDEGKNEAQSVRRTNGAAYWSLYTVISLTIALFCIAN